MSCDELWFGKGNVKGHAGLIHLPKGIPCIVNPPSPFGGKGGP